MVTKFTVNVDEWVKFENELLAMVEAHPVSIVAKLSVSNLGLCLHVCEHPSCSAIQGTGIDFTESNEFVWVSFHFNQKHPSLESSINCLLGILNPIAIGTPDLFRISDYFSETKIGRFVPIPENSMDAFVTH